MTATIIRLDPAKSCRHGTFRRLMLLCADGKTRFCDIVAGFRNEKWWKPIIQLTEKEGVGAELANLKVRDEQHIDADSHPTIFRKPQEV